MGKRKREIDEEDIDITIGGVPIGENMKSNSRWMILTAIIAILTLIVSIATLTITIINNL